MNGALYIPSVACSVDGLLWLSHPGQRERHRCEALGTPCVVSGVSSPEQALQAILMFG